MVYFKFFLHRVPRSTARTGTRTRGPACICQDDPRSSIRRHLEQDEFSMPSIILYYADPHSLLKPLVLVFFQGLGMEIYSAAAVYTVH
jgi:hypothetical protein